MTQLDFDRTLKRDDGFAAKLSKTHQGMAHLGGTGPKGKTCRECEHWGCGQIDYYAASNKTHGPALKPAPCAEYKRRMNGQKGADVPHHASACNAFEQSDNPPPISRRT